MNNQIDENTHIEYFERLLTLLEYCFEYYGNTILPELEGEYTYHYPIKENDYNKDPGQF
jgi:hypothetical protein